MSLPKIKQLRYILSDVTVSPAIFEMLGTNLFVQEKVYTWMSGCLFVSHKYQND